MESIIWYRMGVYMKVKNTKFQTTLEIISFLLLVCMYVYLIINWGSLPEQIPGHYNAAGEIDRWGKKGELVALPIISTVMYLLLTVVQHFPSIWNIPITVTDKNRDQVYRITKSLLMFLKTVLISVFFYLNYNSMKAKPLSPYFFSLFLVGIFVTIGFFLTRLIKAGRSK
jgi:uncharacterized membrane protein